MTKAQKAAAARHSRGRYLDAARYYNFAIDRSLGQASRSNWASIAMYWAFMTLFYGGEL